MPLRKHEAQYRADIDGLRAISVLAVMAFHLKIGLSGGFTGVDVFFVISGYLIGRIVYSEVAGGSFSLSRFYERRARRILPALLATIAISWFVADRYLYAFEMGDFSKSAVASILFAANLYFYGASEYFAPAAETIPLLHLWSLGVEEQFYLLFPPTIVLLGRYLPRLVFATLVLMCLVSLFASQVLVWSHPDAAFYLPISRAFEILFGTLVAHTLFPPFKQSLGMRTHGNPRIRVLAVFNGFVHERPPLSGHRGRFALRRRSDDRVVQSVEHHSDIPVACLTTTGLRRQALLFTLPHPLARDRPRRAGPADSPPSRLRICGCFGVVRPCGHLLQGDRNSPEIRNSD
ncbi:MULTISPECIES: acyltransferase family protein [Bradyrhizobium]|uniref:acyltransferase family protein n=1 Tax=Bradyrhizobium TaxID=374 RepID=UPI001260B203|nr:MULTISPECIES: acyltransferase [Bradyrhizobium]MBR1294529.1 acyltransferase [Bradyrhizobium ottawaense]WLB43954.1 acyltransferase [Bradyrhizobium ottawaense]